MTCSHFCSLLYKRRGYPLTRTAFHLGPITESIGYGLWVNANDKIYFPNYKQNVTLEELSEDQTMPKQKKNSFLGNLYGPEQEANGRWCDLESSSMQKLSVGEYAIRIARLPFAMFMPRRRKSCNASHQSHWWSSFVANVFDVVW